MLKFFAEKMWVANKALNNWAQIIKQKVRIPLNLLMQHHIVTGFIQLACMKILEELCVPPEFASAAMGIGISVDNSITIHKCCSLF